MNWAIKQAVLQQPQSNLNKLAMVAQGQAPGFSNGRQATGPAFPQGYLPDQQPTQYQQEQKIINPQQFNQAFNGQQAPAMPVTQSPAISPYQLMLNKIQASQPRQYVAAPAGLW